MKKRIAIWIHGGIGNGDFSQGYPMLEKIVDRLCDGFEVMVYSHTPPNIGYLHPNIPMKYPPLQIKNGMLRWIYLIQYFLRDHQRKKFHSVMAFWGYPIGLFVSLITRILKVPSVICVLGADSSNIKALNYGVFSKRFPRIIAKWSYNNCTQLVAISQFQANQLRGYGITKYIHIIPWGADASMYSFGQKPCEEVLRIIHVAHLNPVKDQYTLIRAFSIIRKARSAKLTLFGIDTMKGAIHRFCVELGVSEDIEFAGVVPYNEMPDHYRKHDIMLHTSLSEGQCMALTEAAACGVLLAGTKVGLLHDLGNEFGIVVDVGDYQGLAEKVLALLNNPSELRRRIENARRWSVEHDFNWTIQKLTNLLQNL
jgi:glycosyltransferase involved in cell wall biosynthesis